MQLGMIGLGRMGANMVRRLQKQGHDTVVYDRSADTVKQLTSEGPLAPARWMNSSKTRKATRHLADGSRGGRRLDAARTRR